MNNQWQTMDWKTEGRPTALLFIKRDLIFNMKTSVYELLHELPNDGRFNILVNKEILGKSKWMFSTSAQKYTKSDIKVYWCCPTAIFSLFQIYFVGTIHSSKTKKIPKLNNCSTIFVCRLYLVRFFLSMLMLGIPLKVTSCVKQIAETVIKLRKMPL